jgi:hypothetical protein
VSEALRQRLSNLLTGKIGGNRRSGQSLNRERAQGKRNSSRVAAKQ